MKARFLAPLMSALLLALALLGAPARLGAVTLLVNQPAPYGGYGYGLSWWDGMTADLDDAFGAGNITVSTSPLDNLSYLMSFDRLWLSERMDDGSKLSALEIAYIEAFIATGRRVVLVGENSSWTDWNISILQTVGGSYAGNDVGDAILNPVIAHPLTAGVTDVVARADGLTEGGTPVFDQNIVTLWGGSQNVVTMLSVNIIDDTYGAAAGNVQFKKNLAGWLAGGAAKAPDGASTVLLIGLGVVGLAGIRRLMGR